MELLLYAVVAVVAPSDYPDRAIIHCARQAAGFVVVQQAADWKTLFDVPQSLGQWERVGGSPDDAILVLACKELGVVARINMNEKNGPILGVVDVKWQFCPFDPNSPRFSILQLPNKRNHSILVDTADDLIR